MLLARMTSRGAFSKNQEKFSNFDFEQGENGVKWLRNRQLMRSRRKGVKTAIFGAREHFPGEFSLYANAKSRKLNIFGFQEKCSNACKNKPKMRILSWKIHFLWTPLRGRFLAKNTNFGKIFRISFHPDFHFSSQIPSFRWKIRFSRKTSNFDFASRFSRFLHEQNFP